MGAKRERTGVIRAGVDLAFFDRADRLKERNELGFRDNDLVLFFMGWLYEFSGVKEVADALSQQRTESRMKLLVVGTGDLWDYLQDVKKKPGMADTIITVGWQPYNSIPDYIAAADICLLPARNNEIMKNIVPIKMYEYMAAGKPVIATNLHGITKEFGNENGVIYIDSPTAAIQKANELSNINNLHDYGLKSRHFVEQSDWSTITDKFEKSLRDVYCDR
jgi:glycosyltransferase involved in cell wall biosynthesis